MNASFESRANAATSNVGGSTEAAIDAFVERTSELSTLLSSHTQSLEDLIENSTRPLLERLTDDGSKLAEQLEHATTAATERLKAENTALITAIARRTADTVSAVEEAQSGLTESVDDLINRLSASNTTLGQLISDAKNNLGQIDEKLLETPSNFADKAHRAADSIANSVSVLDGNMVKLGDVSNKTLEEVASIAARFEEHGKVLSTASDLLNEAKTGVSDKLEERHSALETLSSGLVSKSEEIEKLMRSFESIATEAFSQVEERTRKSADELSNRLREAAQEAEGTARSSSAAISENVSDIVNSALKRFEEATGEMRRVASDMSKELNQTREEVRKGIFELPEETRESTGAMRRAVSEQISALKELSRIVESSGRAFDIGGERRAAKRPSTPETAPVSPTAPASTAPAPTLRTYGMAKTRPTQAGPPLSRS